VKSSGFVYLKRTVRRYRSHSIPRYFTASEIISNRSNTRIYETGNGPSLGCLFEMPALAKTMYRKVGCPRKHKEGWESVNKRICVLNGTFQRWRTIRDERGLLNDDAVARYLLALHKEPVLTAQSLCIVR